MNPVIVRSMRPDDVSVIAHWMVTTALWQRYHLTVEQACTQFEQALQRKELLLAADLGTGDRACGFAWCMPEGAFGRSAYLRLIGVRSDCAGLGIGKLLLAQVEQQACQFSRHLLLLVSDFNMDAQRFYQSQGYEQIGAIPGYVLPDVTELIYMKHLRENSVTR